MVEANIYAVNDNLRIRSHLTANIQLKYQGGGKNLARVGMAGRDPLCEKEALRGDPSRPRREEGLVSLESAVGRAERGRRNKEGNSCQRGKNKIQNKLQKDRRRGMKVDTTGQISSVLERRGKKEEKIRGEIWITVDKRLVTKEEETKFDGE